MIYVVSDIHGHLDKFKALLDMINFNDDDFMYILGDVLDRGNDPIGLLRFIMDKSNMELLMGNHENDAYIILSMLMMEIDSDDTVDKVLTDDFYDNYNNWINVNGGYVTMRQFKALSDRFIQNDIVDYLSDLRLYEALQIGDRLYILAHSFAYQHFDEDKELDEYDMSDFLYEHVEYGKKYYSDDNIYIVTGHVPTLFINNEAKIYHHNNHIAIDCGAYMENGKLACLCLDNMQEFYI